MANDSKSLFNYVKMGIGIGVGVMVANGIVGMLRRYTGFPPSEFALP